MNFKPLKFLIIFILILTVITSTVFAINNYFSTTKQETIQFVDLDEHEKEWLSGQPKLHRYDFKVFNTKDISEILKLVNNNNCSLMGFVGLNHGYCYNGGQSLLGCWYLKDPTQNLINVYCKPRINPFNKKIPTSSHSHTLDDLLKNETAISEVYVFWDANKQEQEPNISIHHQNFTISDDQNNTNYKEELIKNYLYNQKITNDKKIVKLNCYNSTPNTGIVLPFQAQNKDKTTIEVVYFDDGIRVADSNIEIDNLTKLANGAKNIYLFSFTVIEPHKIEPQKSPAQLKYEKELDEWYKQCYIKPVSYFDDSDYTINKFYEEHYNACTITSSDRIYTGDQIRDHFGSSDRTVYIVKVDGKSYITNYYYKKNPWYSADDFRFADSIVRIKEIISPSNRLNIKLRFVGQTWTKLRHDKEYIFNCYISKYAFPTKPTSLT